jgi:uncharacterized protein
MTGYRLVAWLGPEPLRLDVVSVTFDADQLSAHGSSTTGEYALTYRLATGPRWITRRLDVRVDGDGWWRQLTLERDPEGRWSSRRTEPSVAGDPVTTIAEHDELDGALDCDLGLCPLTNTMPVLRHELLEASRAGETRRIDLTMAWVSVPELDVVASAQHYDPGVPVAGGGAQIRYRSGDFVEHIEFDADGLVVSYPSIGRRIADHSGSMDASRNAG